MQVLEVFFFCLNQCVIFDRERRPWEPYFFTTIKAVCVAQIYFFLRSLKGQILRQTHSFLVCLGIFFSFFLLAGFSGVDVQRVQILGI